MSGKIIAVTGATGAQGGGLARAILADPAGDFQVRALTRDAGTDRAKALAQAGAEVVEADFDRPGDLQRAFEGAYGAFCVTNFWEHFSPEREIAQAEAMAVAARDVGLQHVIWSTLEDTRLEVPLGDDRMPTLMGHYKVPHFDAKGEANHKFLELGVPTTLFHTSFYWDNLIHFGMGPTRGPDGRLVFTLPMADSKLPGIAADDIGPCALGVFQRPELIGSSIGVAGDHPTGAEMAAAMSEALGRDIAYNAVTPEVYRGFGFPGAEDLANMFQYYVEFEASFGERRNVEQSRSLHPSLQTFSQWLAANGARIPIT